MTDLKLHNIFVQKQSKKWIKNKRKIGCFKVCKKLIVVREGIINAFKNGVFPYINGF